MIRLALAGVLALIACAGCAGPTPTPIPLTPVFVLDSSTATCPDAVGVEVAIKHGVAHPGYLDCITVTLRADSDGTVWVCEPVRDPAGPVCEGPQMELRDADVDRLRTTWHDVPEARWSDPVQLLGRVRFL